MKPYLPLLALSWLAVFPALATQTDPSPPLPEKSLPLPPAVDLRPMLEKEGVTPRQQGARGTCSVFTVTTALEDALARLNKPAGRLSVEYLNWASNKSIGQAADGGFFSDLWTGYHDHGICLESEMPYAAKFDPDRKPDPAIVDSNLKQASRLRMNWIKPWDINTGLTDSHFSAIRKTLADGHPVCTGLRWPKKAEWVNGILQMCPPDAVFDGHSVLITGYQEDSAQPGGGTLSFYNSNRPEVECRMPWEYARAYMNDAMWIEPVPE